MTHTILDFLENYIVGNHEKVYLADGEPLDIIGMRDVSAVSLGCTSFKNLT